MKTILTLVLFLVIGFIGSKWFESRAKIRLPFAGLFVTGMEFFFIGILLGPNVLAVITFEVIGDLKPVVYLALGWVGLLFGIEMSWPQMKKVSRSVYWLLILDTLLVICVFSIAAYFLLRILMPEVSGTEKIFAGAMLALTATVSSPAIIAIQAKRLPSRGRFTRVVKVTSALNPLIPLILFGFVFTVVHPGFFGVEGFGKGLLWWIFANVTGLLLGFVMVLFTAERCSEDERTLLIMGTLILVGGLCYYLTFSSLYTAMIMGIVVGNISGRREAIFKQLHQLEKMLFVTFLIIVGSMVTFNGLQTLILLIAYTALRLVLRMFVSSRVVGLTHPEFRSMGRQCGLIFTAQGGIALAFSLEYRMGTSGPLAETVFAVIALAVVLNEVLAFGLTRRSFQVSGEISTRKNAG